MYFSLYSLNVFLLFLIQPIEAAKAPAEVKSQPDKKQKEIMKSNGPLLSALEQKKAADSAFEAALKQKRSADSAFEASKKLKTEPQQSSSNSRKSYDDVNPFDTVDPFIVAENKEIARLEKLMGIKGGVRLFHCLLCELL